MHEYDYDYGVGKIIWSQALELQMISGTLVHEGVARSMAFHDLSACKWLVATVELQKGSSSLSSIGNVELFLGYDSRQASASLAATLV